MKSALFSLFLFSCTFIKAQDNPGIISQRIDTIQYAILNEDRYIWVHVPNRAGVVSRYPVIYILDKNAANEMIVDGEKFISFLESCH